MLINSYFPVDSKCTNNIDAGELIEVLEVVKNMLNKHTYDKLVLLGDINADYWRNSVHCKLIRSFLKDLDLLP